jgi:hypothetical protein
MCGVYEIKKQFDFHQKSYTPHMVFYIIVHSVKLSVTIETFVKNLISSFLGIVQSLPLL